MVEVEILSKISVSSLMGYWKGRQIDILMLGILCGYAGKNVKIIQEYSKNIDY